MTVHCNHVDDQDPSAHDDSMLATNQRIWGYETNYGGLGELSLVKANQLMPKPAHLTWEEAAVNALTNSTSYRMLVSPNGAQMTQGQTVLIWGASGGIGAYACQYVLNGGGIPVGVVSSPGARRSCCTTMGVEHVIDRKAEGFQFWKDEQTQDPAEWRRLGKRIRELVGTDPDIVFEHPGRSTMGASVFVCTRGGTIITCAATSGFMIEYDNRYLWMNQKTLKGCHFANYREAWEANRLIGEGRIHPVLSAVFPFDEVAEAVNQVHHNLHEGKLGVLVLAPDEGLGVTDPELRAQHVDQITLFRRWVRQLPGRRVTSHAGQAATAAVATTATTANPTSSPTGTANLSTDVDRLRGRAPPEAADHEAEGHADGQSAAGDHERSDHDRATSLRGSQSDARGGWRTRPAASRRW